MSRNNDDDDDSGRNSGIQFHDFIGSGKLLRDDLSPHDVKQLLSQHDGTHRYHVEKQLEKQKNREALKNGNMSLNQYRHGQGQPAGYRQHPLIKMRGIDSTENPLPNVNESEVNEELRNENRLENRPSPNMQPTFTPPKLTR